MNFYEIELIVQEHGRRIETEIREIHLIQSFRAGKSSRREKWILKVADLLIGVGLYLKDHYRTACRKHPSSLRASY